MSDKGVDRKLRDMHASFRLTEHDRKLFLNDPLVHELATRLASAIKEYGVIKIAATFRIALAIYNEERR